MLTPPEIARSLLAAGESKARLPFGKMLLLAYWREPTSRSRASVRRRPP